MEIYKIEKLFIYYIFLNKFPSIIIGYLLYNNYNYYIVILIVILVLMSKASCSYNGMI